MDADEKAAQSVPFDALQVMVRQLADMQAGPDARTLIDQIRGLECLKAAAAAAQARLSNAFMAVRRADHASIGMSAKQSGIGIANEVALAKRESPQRVRSYLGFVWALSTELPATFAALERGDCSEWRAMLVHRETSWLSSEDRRIVDAQVGPRLGDWSDRRAAAETRGRAYALDPQGLVERLRSAPKDRHVSLRPAPEGMTKLSALLPLKQGVAVLASLRAAADTAKATAGGDVRARGQIMADTLVERITGQASANAVPVMINLIMRAGTLFRSGPDAEAPGNIPGHGPMPADIARDFADDESAPMWIRRLYTDAETGRLVTMETRARGYTEAQREFLRLRDQTCRTPYCDAPIRHADHVVPSESGGPTSLDNGQGLCEACNYAKQAPGWSSEVLPNGDIEVTTPTGHRHRSRAPSLTLVA